MRRITKKNGQDSCLETAGYEMSIGDLMAGLLYIFIIILMVFVLSYQVQTKRALDELKSSKELRNEMLQEIKEMLDASHIEVEVDMEHGIIHLTENAIHFESARSDLDNSEQAKLAKIATVLVKVLPALQHRLTIQQRTHAIRVNWNPYSSKAIQTMFHTGIPVSSGTIGSSPRSGQFTSTGN